MSYYGGIYGCNPKYLSEYFVSRREGWDIVWGFTKPEKHPLAGFRSVRYLSFRFFYELATCSVFITNYRMPAFYRRRKKQLYIQTWHSSLRLKAIEADARESVSEYYLEMAHHDSRQISLLLSGCEKSTEIFRRAFWYSGEILHTGTPRMDLLFRQDEDLAFRIKASLGLSAREYVVLYAPTFRERNDHDAYTLHLKKLQHLLQQKWGGNWQILLRLHPHMSNHSLSFRDKPTSVHDVTNYDDIQELLYISDVVISDYSSLVFDYLVTGRPCFLYTPDLDEYLEKERNLYFRLEELPFPVIINNDAMEQVFAAFNENDYRVKTALFLQRIRSYETGHACENVYQAIVNHLLLLMR